MFHIECGWLCYDPFKNYHLPDLILCEVDTPGGKHDYKDAPFIRPRTNEVVFTRKLYELRWPGTYGSRTPETTIPIRILRHWPWEGQSSLFVASLATKGPVTLNSIYAALPRELPDSVAYHLSVNHIHYQDPGEHEDPGIRFPVGGLHEMFVQRILDARFAVDDKHFAALSYLKWVAETHYRHPLLHDFDTSIREMLMGLSHKAAKLYFQLLQDCLYDETTHWWSRRDFKPDWWRFALYFHWLGRTGCALPECFAGFRDPLFLERINKEIEGPDKTLWPYFLDRIKEYRENNYNRGLCQVDGKEIEGEVKGPAK